MRADDRPRPLVAIDLRQLGKEGAVEEQRVTTLDAVQRRHDWGGIGPIGSQHGVDHRGSDGRLVAEEDEHGIGFGAEGGETGPERGALAGGVIRIDDRALAVVADRAGDGGRVVAEDKDDLIQVCGGGVSQGVGKEGTPGER